MSIHTFSIANDFLTGPGINSRLFSEEITESSIDQKPLTIDIRGDQVYIHFLTPLQLGEIDELATLASLHDATVNHDSTYIWTLTELKTVGTHGGNALVPGAWITRPLSNISGSTSRVCTLSSNGFQLFPGSYRIYARVPGYRIGSHQARIFNVTDNLVQLLGSSEYSHPGFFGSQTHSVVEGVITVSGVGKKVFRLEHSVSDTKKNSGYGRASARSESEVFSVVSVELME